MHRTETRARIMRAAARTAHLARLIAGPMPTRFTPEGSEGDFDRFADSWIVGKRLTVPTDYSDQSPYDREADNHAARAWHDSYHVLHGLGFTVAEELELSDMMEAAGERWARRLLPDLTEEEYREIRLFIGLDNGGQTAYFDTHGEFPVRQFAFILACWEEGLARVLDSGRKF